MNLKDLPTTSWEVFDECETCCTGPKEPCYRLNSTSKKPVINQLPHHGRKRLK